MHNTIIIAVLAAAAGLAPGQGLRAVNPVSFSEVRIEDGFWSSVIDNNKKNTLPVCIDQIENQTGRMRNFENAGRRSGGHSGIFYDDSDVYKALEGMAYSLKNNPDPALEARCDEWIAKFEAAQEPDGYLFTYYTLKGLDGRWSDMNKHEMYCAGHLIEAAVAYYDATGKRRLLDVAVRVADHLMSVFGPGKRDWVPGHEEIELALVKLYGATGEMKYVEFADWLLSERGRGLFAPSGKRDTGYCQDDVPVRDITDIKGHAVRAMYLYCGMADVAAVTGDKGYVDALGRVWSDVVERNMYITGGIGSSKSNEGFTEDYDLPNREAYCETCASIGMVFWNWRMNQLTGESKYIDVCERAIYNGVLAGVSSDGGSFFYVNPLESDGTHHRKPWYGTACCPSNLCRFIPSIGNYIYGVSDDAVWVNLYIGNEATVGGLELGMDSAIPFGDGSVNLSVNPVKASRKAIRFRIPGWCGSDYAITVNGKPFSAATDRGYAVVDRKWKKGDKVTISFGMPARIVSADPRVKADEGKHALMRGPLVYCLEETDNAGLYDRAYLDSEEVLAVRDGGRTITSRRLRFVPYYSWDNRGAGRMKVWVDAVYPESHPEIRPVIDIKPDRTVLLYPEGQAAGKGITENGVQVTLGPSEDNGARGEETMTSSGKRSNIGDDARMDFYFPEHPNGQLVIITPGGGYSNVSSYNEGVYGAKWYTDRGLIACSLKYRMPNGHHTITLEDVQNAFRYCRHHAEEWGVKQIGVSGGSAGGHLVSIASTMYVDSLTRPDFAILLYPRITLRRGEQCDTKEHLVGTDESWDWNPEAHEKLLAHYSADTHVTPDTPPTFIVLSANDNSVPATNMIPYYTQLIRNDVWTELHVYPLGGHGWGFSDESIKGKGKDKFARYRPEFEHALERWLEDLRNE